MSPLGLDVAFVERSPWEFFPLGDDGHFIGQTSRLNKHDFGFNTIDEQHDLKCF